MDTQKSQPEKQSSSTATAPSVTSCRKKKNEEAAFLDDLKDHIDEFINASMDEHKTCFKKTIQKVGTSNFMWKNIHITFIVCWCCVVSDQSQMFGMSKAVAEGQSNASKEVESSLPLQTTVQD